MGRYQSFVRFPRGDGVLSRLGRAQQARDDPGSPRPPSAAWRSPSPRKVPHLMLWTILVILLIVLVVLAIMGRGRFGSR
jgi:hypothetical protein